jgi:uncharacterized membrane protein YjgN (DUF898 family)
MQEQDDRTPPGVHSGAPVPEASATIAPTLYETGLRFHGSGSEYFRIWVVNTLLSLLTLGVYSAWAKLRAARYFARNTEFLGDRFDFVADPWAILRGRCIAVGLLALYTFGFDFSLTLGLAAVALLFALGPALLLGASRFRYANTRWRGVSFGFDASLRQAYGMAGPVMAVWLSSTLAAALTESASWLLVCSGLTSALWPWMHHRLKAFQHRHIRFGTQCSSFESALGSLYGTYLLTGFMIMFVGMVAGVAAAALAWGAQAGESSTERGWVVAAVVGLGFFMTAWPVLAVRTQRAVWARTSFGPLMFRTDVTVGAAWKLALRSVVLVLLTAGLYWPFAKVAWARLRIEAMTVASEVPFEECIGQAAGTASPAGAAGEGAMDLFGFDLGW